MIVVDYTVQCLCIISRLFALRVFVLFMMSGIAYWYFVHVIMQVSRHYDVIILGNGNGTVVYYCCMTGSVQYWY